MSKLLIGIIGPEYMIQQIVNQLAPLKIKNIEYKLFIIQQ